MAAAGGSPAAGVGPGTVVLVLGYFRRRMEHIPGLSPRTTAPRIRTPQQDGGDGAALHVGAGGCTAVRSIRSATSGDGLRTETVAVRIVSVAGGSRGDRGHQLSWDAGPLSHDR